MDRRIDSAQAARVRDRVGPKDPQFVLPSRLEGRSACLQALRAARGPVLLTGEAGSGKTWLWKTLAGVERDLGRWLSLDAAPSDSGLDLLRRILRGLGRRDAAQVIDPRAELADELAEQAEDGRRWILALDEAQNASDEALEEFRLLSNRLGQPDGFGGLLLVGRTGLAFRLRGRAWESLESRLAAHVSLGPIDAEEARTLLERCRANRAWTGEIAEALHARAAANPARLLRLADQYVPSLRVASPATSRPAPAAPRGETPELAARLSSLAWPEPSGLRDRVGSRAGSDQATPQARRDESHAEPEEPDGACCAPPHLGEPRPPLRFEDGMIEVGWAEADPDDPEMEAVLKVGEPTTGDRLDLDRLDLDRLDLDSLDEGFAEEPVPRPIEPSTVDIDDPIAAIEARSQWARAVEAAQRATGCEAACGLDRDGRREPGEPCSCDADAHDEEGHQAAARLSAQVRAESGQEFAPYSRLFSQSNSTNETE